MKKLKRILSILIIAIISLWFVSSRITAATININGIDIIYTNPGQDCSTEMTISWHSSIANSKLIYTLASDETYNNAITINAVGVYDNESFVHYDKASFYKTKVELKDLIPDTEYIYKISNSVKTSEEHRFKTAGTSDFTFGYMSDVHAVPYDNLDKGMTAITKMQTVQTLLNQANEKTNGIDFILTSGDEVWRGSQYTNWQEWSKTQYTTALNDYMWAGAVGNHEYYTQFTSSVWNYYPDKWSASSDRDKIYSDKESYYNTYFNAVKAVPQNGPSDNEATYWFLYNNVLFIALDSMMANEYGQLNAMREWFEDVVLENEGKYQYIIVYQHYPWYDFQTGSDKYASHWNDLFDKYGVDLALSGHMHGYLRTKSINNKKVANNGNGTVYVVSPQVGDRPKNVTGYQNEELFASRIDTSNFDDFSAMSAISVSKEKINYKLFDSMGNILDEFNINAKREYNLENDAKEKVEASITASSSENAIYIDINNQYSRYVSEMKLIVNNKTLDTIYPSTTKNCTLIADNLNEKAKYELKVDITYIDGTTISKDFTIYTTPYFGCIYNLNAKVNNDKVNITWDKNLLNNLVANFKILINNEEITTLTNDRSNYEIDKSFTTIETLYTLQALTSSGEVIYENSFYYNLYGDINYDGKIDSGDISYLLKEIVNKKNVGNNALRIIDTNKDGYANISDLTTIVAYVNNKTTVVKEYTYTVIFIDESGKILSTQEVLEGENAVLPTAPNKNGYIFSHWSIPTNGIYRNLIIRPVYEEGVE